MVRKRRLVVIIGIIILSSVILAGINHLYPFNLFIRQQKPEQAPQKAYDFYLVVDVETDRTLMYVPVVVSVGDEVITEENKRYQVVRVEENRAYARFVENINLEQYTPPPQ